MVGKLWDAIKASVSQVMDKEDLLQMSRVELLKLLSGVDTSRTQGEITSFITLLLYRAVSSNLTRIQRSHYQQLRDEYDIEDKHVDTCFDDAMAKLSGTESILCDFLIDGKSDRTICIALGWSRTKLNTEKENLRRALERMIR